MKAEGHNKLLGIAFLVIGGVYLLSLLSTLISLPMIFSQMASVKSGPTVMRILTIVIYFAVGLNLFLGLLDSIAGFGILKRKQWGRVLGIVAAVPSLLGIPLGTALGIYALWFMTSERGKNFYLGLGDGEQYLPPPPPQSWQQG